MPFFQFMKNSFFHERAAFLFSQRSLRGRTFLRANRQIRHCVATARLRQARRERRCLFLFCEVCPHVFGAAVRFSFCATSVLFSKEKAFSRSQCFCSSDGILRCVLFHLSSWVGLSAGTPQGAQVSRRLGKRTAAEKWRRFCKFQPLADPLNPRGTAVCGLCSGYGEGIRTFSLGARKGVSPRRHTVFSSFVVPLASLWSRQILGRYFGRKSV